MKDKERSRRMYQKYAQLRDDAGLTDYAISKKTGVSSATLICWRNGEYTPKLDKLMQIADAFHIPITELIEA